jgi:hypothetical protein
VSAKFAMPRIGSAITIFWRGQFEFDKLGASSRGRNRVWVAQRHHFDSVLIRPEDEGITWARGHEGKAVDALRVASALAASRSA